MGRARQALSLPFPHGFEELLTRDPALGNDAVVEQHDWDAPVIEVVQAIVGVDVGELRVVAERAQET